MKHLLMLMLVFVVGNGLYPAAIHAQDAPERNITIEQAVFATGVEDREPVGAGEAFPGTVGRLYFWTELAVDTPPASITHVWYYEETKMLEVPLDANYERTRTWSYKTILPDWVGAWHVDVVDDTGTVLKRFSCNVGE